MLRGLWTLTWLEIKIFVREPLGVIGSVGIPVAVFVIMSRLLGGPAGAARAPRFVTTDLPVFVSILVAVSTVMSLVAIIAIYREGGILKRLRATPLRPHTILTAHVIVKLLLTLITLAAMALAGRRYVPAGSAAPLLSFTAAVLFCTTSIVSLGFLIASLVPTARFAQPIGALVAYPMLALSGLFVPLDALPPALQAVSRLLPLTYAVSLMRGIWHGEGWAAHAGDAGMLILMFAIFTAIASRVFRWE